MEHLDKLAYIIKAAPASRQIPDPFAALYGAGLAIQPPLPPERLLILAEENAIHAACLKAKSDDAVGRGWHFIGDTPQEEVERLLEEITPEWTFAELLAAASWELEAIGWSAWEIVRQDGEIAAIYPMPAHTLRVTPTPGVYLQIRGAEERKFVAFGQSDSDDVSEVILFRAYSPRSPYYGIPRWISAIPAIAELTAIREYNIAWYSSGATADRIISVRAASLADAQKTANDIRAALEEASGRGHVSIVTASTTDASVDVMFLVPQVGRREGQYVRRREDLAKEVLMAHGVPPYRIGWAELGSLGGSAAREMLRAYRTGVIEPIQTVLEARINHQLFGPQGLNLNGRWQLDDIGWDETELDLEISVQGIKHGLLTPNEARQVLGRAPVDDPALDRYYLSREILPAEERPLSESKIPKDGHQRHSFGGSVAEAAG